MPAPDDLTNRIQIVQRISKKIDEETIRKQLRLNRWLSDETLVRALIGNPEKLTVMDRDFGPEAIISGSGGKFAELPGFYATRNDKEHTVVQELNRAADYIGTFFIPKLGDFKRIPINYRIDKIEPDEKRKNVLVHLTSEPFEAKTEEEYWEQYVKLELLVKYDPGRAVRALAEAYDHHVRSSNIPHTQPEARARVSTTYSLKCIMDMVCQSEHRKVATKKYPAENGHYLIEDLDFCLFAYKETRDQITNGKQNIIVPVDYMKKVD